jgi:hypothetical protein
MSSNTSHHTANSTHTSNSTSGISPGNRDGKPPLPYIIGATFTAHRHTPAPPFGHGYPTPWPPFKTLDFRLLSQLEYVLSRPPLPGHMYPESRTLTITSVLRTGYTYAAQVVVVNEGLLAKIYDPLYDNWVDCWDSRRDVVVLADGDYTREAAAFEELARSPDKRIKKVTPEYYGSWSINVRTIVGNKTYSREVRLVLMEWVRGTVMSSIDAGRIGRYEREGLVEKVLRAESMLFKAGVRHRDVSPRNVVVVNGEKETGVVVIDFNVSNVLRLSNIDTNHDEVERRWPGHTLGPVTRFWDRLQEFEVRSWLGDGDGEANEWLWETFGEGSEFVKLVRGGDEYPRVAWNEDEEERAGGTGSMSVNECE